MMPSQIRTKSKTDPKSIARKRTTHKLEHPGFEGNDLKAVMDFSIQTMISADIFKSSTEFVQVRNATATYLILFNARIGLYYYHSIVPGKKSFIC